MSLLAMGVTHRDAPLPELERMAVSSTDRPGVLAQLLRSSAINEAMLVSTCNRVEVYAAVSDRRQAAAHLTATLARHADMSVGEAVGQGFVHHEDAAVRHLFEVAAGLDSLIAGDEQVLGQLRVAYAASTAAGATGPVLHALAQQALRVGKQVRTDTGLSRAGASVIEAALGAVAAALPGSGIAGRRAVVLGAGAMGSLAVAHLQRRGAGEVMVVNRTPSRASQLAARTGSTAVRAVPPGELAAVLARADVLMACTTSPGAVVSTAQVRAAVSGRASDRGPLVICDLGLPRNVDPAVASLPGIVLVDLQTLQHHRQGGPATQDVAAARRIVSAELDAYTVRRRTAQATPTIVSLREHAAAVVEAELARLDRRVPTLDATARSEVARAVQRIANKLLHAPTVAPEQLAAAPDAHRSAQTRSEEVVTVAPGTEWSAQPRALLQAAS